jgi:hypothetical protein
MIYAMESRKVLRLYALGLPASTAVIGVTNPAQLVANAAATHASPMDPAARRELERLLG